MARTALSDLEDDPAADGAPCSAGAKGHRVRLGGPAARRPPGRSRPDRRPGTRRGPSSSRFKDFSGLYDLWPRLGSAVGYTPEELERDGGRRATRSSSVALEEGVVLHEASDG